MSDVISVSGHLCVDYIINVEEYPPVGESRKITDRRIYFGGGAANIAVGIAALGGNAELISSVGADFPDSPYEAHLKKCGVATHLFRSEKNCSTAFMVNNANGDQITYFEWGAGEAFARSVPPAREFVHMATGDAEFNIKIAKAAKFASLDPGQDVKYYTAAELKTLFDEIDLLICNNFEMNIMEHTLRCSEKDILESIPTAIITEGKKGSTLYANNEMIPVPAVQAAAKDPTGAGDAYRAGLFTAMKRGLPLETCCKVGAVTSSFVVEEIGTQTNLPDWDKMQKRFEQHFGRIK